MISPCPTDQEGGGHRRLVVHRNRNLEETARAIGVVPTLRPCAENCALPFAKGVPSAPFCHSVYRVDRLPKQIIDVAGLSFRPKPLHFDQGEWLRRILLRVVLKPLDMALELADLHSVHGRTDRPRVLDAGRRRSNEV